MLDIYQRSLDRMREILAATKPEQYGGATPCTEYTVKDLINHIVGGLHMYLAAADGGAIDPKKTPADHTADDPVAEFDRVRKLVIDAWSAPGMMERTVTLPMGELPAPRALGIALMESAIHGWDLAKATGQDAAIDDEITTMFLDRYAKTPIPQELRDAGIFGPEVTVPADASPTDRLVAYLGRTP